MNIHKNFRILTGLLATLLVLTTTAASAYDPEDRKLLAHETPKQLEGVGITEHLGERIDMNLEFTSDSGEVVPLGRFFDGRRPVLMTMVYYNCPSLCNYHLNGLLDVFKKMDWSPGQEFDLVAISMNHRETATVASEKKANYIKAYGRPESANGWHFLTGSEENVKKVADQLGFSFRWDEQQQQYAHSAAAFVMTPGGKISRYLYGIEFDPKTLRLGLLEASDGKIGSVIDQVILFCFQFDPAKNKYTLYAFNIMRAGAVLVVLVLAIILVPMWLRERKKTNPLKGES